MASHVRPAIVIFVLLTVITGLAYPLAITGIARTLFPLQAGGSLLSGDRGPAGSSLIGQEFSEPGHFWGRPSATSPVPYTAFNPEKGSGSSGSNLAPTNPALVDAVKGRIDALRAADAATGYQRPPGSLVPIDLVTASGSGLDPHISPAAAEYQVPRVARARGLSEDRVRALVQANTSPRHLGILGEPVVNVLTLNLALEATGR